MKRKIYLCSRVSQDAHVINNTVADALKDAGYDVYVPHLQPFNSNANSSDSEIYAQDMAAMKEADMCVAVGRLGVDCAFECGYFQGSGVPIYWYKPADVTMGRSPMLHFIQATATYPDLGRLIEDVIQHNPPQSLLSTLLRFKP